MIVLAICAIAYLVVVGLIYAAFKGANSDHDEPL